MKSAELNIKTNQIEPTEHSSLILNEEIILDLNFNSTNGFTFSYPDFRVEYTEVEYHKALKGFYNTFYNKLKRLSETEIKNEDDQKDWDIVKKLIGNPGALKK